ncbi:MAG: methylenetetrahydrofolate reductase [Acidobacteriota bacterium]
MTKCAGPGSRSTFSVAVSPFKYTEPDCVYQYLKLEKKIAAGADFAITQLGYDSKKFRELKRYLAEHGHGKFPVFGNVYILSGGAAKKFAKGEPPGCWASEELRDTVVAEAEASDRQGRTGSAGTRGEDGRDRARSGLRRSLPGRRSRCDAPALGD